VRAALSASLDTVQGRLAWGERLGVLFTGISLGSILLLVALGLAITYGLMGVINMAHGELMMIGAYATWLVQNLFRQLCCRAPSTGTSWRPSRPASSSPRWWARCSSAA
jgi:urea transport system permease protein